MTSSKRTSSPGNQIARWAERALLGILGAAILAYFLDWAVFTLRGKPLSQVAVNSYLSVPLKGNKTEYDYEGTQPIPCARALFPQAGSSPCWYLRRHTTQADKIGAIRWEIMVSPARAIRAPRPERHSESGSSPPQSDGAHLRLFSC
jgi:hypothetical protein